MRVCWSEQPSVRPSFTDLKKLLGELLEEVNGFLWYAESKENKLCKTNVVKRKLGDNLQRCTQKMKDFEVAKFLFSFTFLSNLSSLAQI